MASISSDGNGTRRIQFVGVDGGRKTLRLGRVTAKQADEIRIKVENLIASLITGTTDDVTSKWLASRDGKLYQRLVAVGLAKPRQDVATTLGAFIEAYIADRTDAKPNTIKNLKQARKDLIEFFGSTRPLRDITPGEADEFWRYLLRRVAHNTARRLCGRAKQFYRAAARKHLVSENPFADLRCHVQATQDRDYFISRDHAKLVLDACPDTQWRLLFALSRYAGLRCPSEHLALTWKDVDWEHDRFTIRSPKTEHHEGGATRVVPIFPELRPYLEEAYELAAEGDLYVITRYRDTNANLRTQLVKIIEKAGLTAWPKLFHNLRATRQIELAETWPEHIVCAWIGNSVSVARKHYLRATEEHFQKATQIPTHSETISDATGRSDVPQNAKSRVKTRDRAKGTPPRGVDDPPETPENTGDSEKAT